MNYYYYITETTTMIIFKFEHVGLQWISFDILIEYRNVQMHYSTKSLSILNIIFMEKKNQNHWK